MGYIPGKPNAKLSLLVIGAIAVMAQQQAHAEDAAAPAVQSLERVEVTGSSIKRIAKEGAIPVQVLTADDIKKSGATTATELVQNLPAMQGFVPSSSSVNGGGAGVTTAALHSLPSKYTLVLLDGQRVAPLGLGNTQGGGFGVNLESIPLSAIERVEILTDGASALYGSDAIAGVVNFITKKNSTEGEIFAETNHPQKSGGTSYSLGVTKGWGDLNSDGFNILGSYSHDQSNSLAASQRSFSATGAYFPFSSGGQRYIYDNRTSNTQPANVILTGGPTFNPYYIANGNCGTPLAAIGSDGATCRFNYAATVQDLPSTQRDSVLLKGTKKLGESTTAFAEVVYSRVDLSAQYAPAAQTIAIDGTKRLPSLWNQYVVPYLSANDVTGVTKGKLGFRSVTAGGRTDDYVTTAFHTTFGVDGEVMGWTYKAGLTFSSTDLQDIANGGYTDYTTLAADVANGSFNPITGAGASSLNAALLNGTEFSKTTSTLNTLHLGAQHDLFDLPGGTSIVSLGGEYSYTHYTVGYNSLILSQSGFSTQPDSTDYPVGGNYGQVPFDAERKSYGLFGELLLPLAKNLEATLSARYDSYDKVYSRDIFAASADANGVQQQLPNGSVGNSFNASTYKASLRWQPLDSLLIRGAYGTGFKAPTISDIAGTVTYAGVTSGSYLCPFPGSPGCTRGTAQYDLVSGGNALSGSNGLKPEKSKQATFGFRVDPIQSLSLGLDWWQVKINDQVLPSGIAEQVGFGNPSAYSSLFVNPYADPSGSTTIAFSELASNGGYAKYEGIDWDFVFRTPTPIGRLGVIWTGTYMLTQEYTQSLGGTPVTDLGQYGPDQAVVFRVQSHLIATLESGAFTNSVSVNYKSGYKDQTYSAGSGVYLANPDGSRGAGVAFSGLSVPEYYTVDWQGKWAATKAFTLTGGIKNIFDKEPPLSLQSGGGGNQIGYDGRYTDPLGRTFYLRGSYKF